MMDVTTYSDNGVLPEDPLPTPKQYHDIIHSFLTSLLLVKAKKQLIAWSVFGLGGAAYAHRLGYQSYVSAGVVAMTASIPYFLIWIGAKKLGHDNMKNRQDAFNSAKNLLVEQITAGRAKRLPTCDVYYPSLSSKGERKAKIGFVFYPGALVDRTAYAPVATILSDRGIMVVVVNLEPTRLLLSAYNYNFKEKIQRMISDALLNSPSGDGVWEVDEWSIGGHSMGANAAITAVAKDMSSTIKKVVLYGSGAFPDKTFSDCPPLRDAAGVKVLVINGSEDTFATSTVFYPDKERVFREKMPPVISSHATAFAFAAGVHGYTIRETIEGGNHAGCASYGPQTFPFPDGVRTIALEEQQKNTAKLTADFLLRY